MHENLSTAVLLMLLRELLQLREDALPELLGLAMGSCGLAISEVILGFLEVALVYSGLLRSLKSPCVAEGCWAAALHSSALLAVMVTIHQISASFIPEPSGCLTHGQSYLNQRRSIPWFQQGVGVKKDH